MKRSIYLLSLFLLAACFSALCPTVVLAHPHSFVETYVSIIFDDDGMAGVRERWVIDEMTTVTVLEAIQYQMDQPFGQAQVDAIKKLSMGSIKGYGYFTDIRIEGHRFKPTWLKDFKATLKDGKLTYDFVLPCHVKASTTPKKICVGVYDDSFYVFFAYGVEGQKTADPTKDPLFTNQAAGASPEDFKRFSDSVELQDYVGDVKIEGPLDKYVIKADVHDTPEMKYFFEQVTPQAFWVQFQKKSQ